MPIRVKPSVLRFDAYYILERAVEEGIAYAKMRAERGKEPFETEHITRAIMNNISEIVQEWD